MMQRLFFTVLATVSLMLTKSVYGFISPNQGFPQIPTTLRAESSDVDPSDIIARRITVTGDVQGGYYRSCVLNEAGRFRRLIGTMTPPDDTDSAEIYVEGKRKMVEGFIRWCRKGDVGLSQVAKVSDIQEEDPTGLYDGFYVKTH